MKAHPDNVEGPFHVEERCCLRCEIPMHLAPSLFNYTENRDHCFVHRQPETESDLKLMIKVLDHQEMFCIRCRSHDRQLLKRLRKAGHEESCDPV